MNKLKTLKINEYSIVTFTQNSEDYISLTDMARFKNAEITGIVISHWLSTRYTVEFMGLWEKMNNPQFNVTEFSYIKNVNQWGQSPLITNWGLTPLIL